MNKRIIGFLLCFCVLAGCVLPVYAAEEEAAGEAAVLVISDVADFLEFAENCRLDSYSYGLTVQLEADLDMTDAAFSGVPIFCGTFEGNGHTISGLNIGAQGSVQGLFRYLTETAIVRDLKVQGNLRPGGSRSDVGGIAGSNAGQILNCSFTGTIAGVERVGGLAGVNTVSGIIEGSKSGGVIAGSHFVGGIAGENNGVIRQSQNLAQINSSARQNEVELADITLDSLLNSESSNTVTDIGGIAGTSTGVIRECTNRGDVGYQHMGYNIGGIAGSQSGYIVDCVNYGRIMGRKEVGGIAGQMEPAALIDYDADALQLLQDQLSAMGQTVNRAVTHVQVGAQDMENRIYDLQDHMENAMDAVDTLVPDLEDPELPDMDTIQAAQNGISDSIAGMTSTLWGIGETTESSMGNLTNDLYRLKDQMDAMRATLGNISENLGGSLADVSDADTEEDLTGKLENCINYGGVLGDLNIGGITGAMALENDLDPEDDWQISGENSLNFESQLRAVVRNCENTATVTARKQNAGGIVGWQSLGLVRGSQNSGALDAADADYVGGISGRSTGYIRESSARCAISGSTYAGGIAGSATVVTDCLSMVTLNGIQEKQGAILGLTEEGTDGEEEPIRNNRYLPANSDPGGIDGISYQGLAEPVEKEAFLSMEALPEMFRKVTITFCHENGTEERVVLHLGEMLTTDKIPALPQQEGRTGVWQGLEDADLTEVYFDMTFEAVYIDEASVIQSAGTMESGKPIVLLEGSFSAGTEIRLSKPDISVGLVNGQKLLDYWSYSLSGAGTVTAVRMCLPEDADAEHLLLLAQDEDGLWVEAEFTVDGSYAVLRTDAQEMTIAIIQEKGVNLLLVGGISLAVIAVFGFLIIKKKKKA